MIVPDRRMASVILTILLFVLGLFIIYVAGQRFILFALAILFAYLINPVVRFPALAKAPGSGQIWRYRSVTVCPGACLTI